MEVESRKRHRTPAEEVADRVSSGLTRFVPRKYERIGDILILRFPPVDAAGREEIAAAYADVLGAKTVVADRGIGGPWREPDVETVFGGETETIHVEDGVRFKLDVADVMFSSGNVPERIRMGRLVCRGETIVDLFAGIGYFALPMAVHGQPERIVACEVNPTAFRYLEENVRLNRAWRVEPRLGDCRTVAPPKAADRIVMGHFDAPRYLDVAMKAANAECILHYHEAVPIAELPDGPWARIESAANRSGFRAERLAVRRIKSVAPRVRHVVFDVRLTR